MDGEFRPPAEEIFIDLAERIAQDGGSSMVFRGRTSTKFKPVTAVSVRRSPRVRAAIDNKGEMERPFQWSPFDGLSMT